MGSVFPPLCLSADVEGFPVLEARFSRKHGLCSRWAVREFRQLSGIFRIWVEIFIRSRLRKFFSEAEADKPKWKLVASSHLFVRKV